MNLYSLILALPLNELLLLIVTLCSILQVLYAERTPHQPYKVHIPRNGAYVIRTNIDVKPLDTSTIEVPANKLNIKWMNSTTSTITINWTLSSDYNLTGFIKDSVVEYITQVGRFRSHPIHSDIRLYTLENLEAGTLYTICVSMCEMHGWNNISTFEHSKCVKINTLDYIRRDSLIIVMVTLGYYIFMGLLGYTQWKRRQWRASKRMDKRYTDADITQNNICAVRWQDLEERDRLMSKPGCSNEYNDT